MHGGIAFTPLSSQDIRKSDHGSPYSESRY